MEEEIDILEILINLIKQHPAIHDKSSTDYKNVVKKREGWEEIATEIYNITCKETSVEEIKNQWEKLKNQFRDERMLLRKYTPSGSGLSAKKQESDWEYFDLMNSLYKYPANLEGCESGSFSNKKKKEKGNDMPTTSGHQKMVEALDDSDSSASLEEIATVPTIRTAYPNNVNQFAQLEQENNYFLALRACWRRVPDEKKVECYRKVVSAIRKKISQRKK